MSSHRILTVLLVVAVVAGTVPTPVAAQEQRVPGRLLLSERATLVGQVSLDGQTYSVYRYENRLPYASGIEIHAADGPVTDEPTARTVLKALARKRAGRRLASRLGDDDLAALRRIDRSVARELNETRALLSAINRTNAALREARATTVNGTSLRRAAFDAAPRLETYTSRRASNSSLALRLSLQNYHAALTATAENVTALIDRLERSDRGENVSKRALYRRYEATLASLERLQQLRAERVGHSEATRMVRMADRIAANLSTLERGERLAGAFREVSDASAAFVEGDGSTTLPVEGLAEDRVQPVSWRSEWLASWHARRNAAIEVYGTFAGLLVGIVGLGVGAYLVRSGRR